VRPGDQHAVVVAEHAGRRNRCPRRVEAGRRYCHGHLCELRHRAIHAAVLLKSWPDGALAGQAIRCFPGTGLVFACLIETDARSDTKWRVKIFMKLDARNWLGLTLAFCSTVTGFAAAAMEPQTLFNFQAGLGDVTGALVQGPDGNFYGTTAHGGPLGGGTVFRVTPAGVLTTLVTDQANPAGLIVGNDNLLYGMMSSGGPFASGTAFKMTPSGPAVSPYRLWASSNLSTPVASWALLTNDVFTANGTFSYTDSTAAPTRFYRVSTP